MKRPISIIVLSILDILTGGLFTLYGGAGLFGQLMGMGMGGAPNLGGSTMILIWAVILGILLFGLAQIATGIGLILLKTWSRWCAFVCSAILLLFAGLALIQGILLVVVMKGSMTGAGNSFVSWMGWISIAISLYFAANAIAHFIYLNLSNVKKAFNPFTTPTPVK